MTSNCPMTPRKVLKKCGDGASVVTKCTCVRASGGRCSRKQALTCSALSEHAGMKAATAAEPPVITARTLLACPTVKGLPSQLPLVVLLVDVFCPSSGSMRFPVPSTEMLASSPCSTHCDSKSRIKPPHHWPPAPRVHWEQIDQLAAGNCGIHHHSCPHRLHLQCKNDKNALK